jgi:hypothetical protein
MRTIVLLGAAGLMLVQDMAGAQDPWSSVKTWAGTVTVEATGSEKGESYSWSQTYKATGAFKATDDMLPDGNHVQWPMPSVETMTDPSKAATAYQTWQAHVTARYEAKWADEMGRPRSKTCAADHAQPAAVGVLIQPMAPTYSVSVTAPEMKFKCTGDEGGPVPGKYLQQPPFNVPGQRGAPAPVSGSKTFAVGHHTVTVSYEMAPSK